MEFFDSEDEEYDANIPREDYINKMELEGYQVLYPDPNELFIDMDTDEHYYTFCNQVMRLTRDFPTVVFKVYPSRNGLPGRHAIVVMPFDLTVEGRIAWQAAMGSDPVREQLSLFRMVKGDIHPTLFVERKDWKCQL